MKKPVFEVSDQVQHTQKKRAVQPQKMARELKIGILEVEGLYSLLSKNKGSDQRGCQRFCFRICKNRLSRNMARLLFMVMEVYILMHVKGFLQLSKCQPLSLLG